MNEKPESRGGHQGDGKYYHELHQRHHRCYRQRLRLVNGVNELRGRSRGSFYEKPSAIGRHHRRYQNIRRENEFLNRREKFSKRQIGYFEKQGVLRRDRKAYRQLTSKSLFREQAYLQRLIYLLRKRLGRINFHLRQRFGHQRMRKYDQTIA